MSTLITFIQYIIGSPSHSNQTRKIKGIQIGLEEVQLSLYTNDVILYIKNPKDSTHKLLEVRNELSKAAVYNIYRALCYPFSLKMKDENEKVKKKIHFKIMSKKYLGIKNYILRIIKH